MISTRELREVPTRHLHDHVVERRLEVSGGCFGNLIFQFIKRVANREFCSNLRNRITGRLTRQGRRTTYPWVNFNNDQFLRFRINRELDITTTGKVAQRTHGQDGLVAHFLVSRIRKRHRWCHRDRITRVNTHWVEVFHRTDDHHIVRSVTQELQLVFFPPKHCLLHQHLVRRAHIQTVAQLGIKLLG